MNNRQYLKQIYKLASSKQHWTLIPAASAKRLANLLVKLELTPDITYEKAFERLTIFGKELCVINYKLNSFFGKLAELVIYNAEEKYMALPISASDEEFDRQFEEARVSMFQICGLIKDILVAAWKAFRNTK